MAAHLCVLPFNLAGMTSRDASGGALFNKAMERLAGLFNACFETKILLEKQYLAMSPEELKTAQRSYSVCIRPSCGEYDVGDWEERTKPVDLQECRENIAEAESFSRIATTAGVLLKTEVFLKTADAIQDFFDFSRDYQRRAALLDLDTIPENLHEDPVFAENICPITLAPIRYPLRDPTTGTVYEGAAITQWVRLHGTSPLSRRPLNERDLEVMPEMEARIIERLRFHYAL
jgi:hypothetical protein